MPFIRLKKEPGKENNANAQVVDRRCKRKNPENKKPAWPWRNWHGPFPTLLSKCVFISNNWPTSRWWVASLPANTKGPSDYKRTVNPQEIIIIMSDIQRLTLISDPTNKFSQNATTVSRYDCLNVSPFRAINGMPRCCPWLCLMKDRAVVWSPVILIPKWSDWVCVWPFEKKC